MDAAAVMASFAHVTHNEHERDLESRRVRRRTDLHCKPWLRDEVVAGDDVMGAMCRTLDAWSDAGFPRSNAQVQLHSLFLAAAARKIYGSDFPAHAERLKLQMGWNELKLHALAVTPRRWGKTVGVCMFIAAYLYCVPHSKQIVFSTGRRASRMLLEQVHAFVTKLPGGQGMIKTFNVETLELVGPGGVGDVRTVSSYPGAARVRARSRSTCLSIASPALSMSRPTSHDRVPRALATTTTHAGGGRPVARATISAAAWTCSPWR